MKEEEVTTDVVDVMIYACGGFGINTLTRVHNLLPKSINTRIIDTSRSNISTSQLDGITQNIVDGKGSGKVRASNLEAISKYISSDAFATTQPADVNIVIFSLAGGSGSVIGPLLIKELHRRNKALLAIIVADTASQLDAENTYKTLCSLENICQADRIYLPIMVFDNIHRRSVVDATLQHRLLLLTKLFTMDVFEMDRSDKINWLRPDKCVGAATGIKGCHISYGSTGDYSPTSGEIVVEPNNFIYDSIILVTPSADAKAEADTRILYHGINQQPEGPDDKFIGYTGFPVSTELVDSINSALHKYQSQQSETPILGFQTQSKIIGHNSGLII